MKYRTIYSDRPTYHKYLDSNFAITHHRKLVVTFKVRDFYCHSIYINFILTDAETLHSDMKNYFEIRNVKLIMKLKYFHNHVNETKLVKYRMIKNLFK